MSGDAERVAIIRASSNAGYLESVTWSHHPSCSTPENLPICTVPDPTPGWQTCKPLDGRGADAQPEWRKKYHDPHQRADDRQFRPGLSAVSRRRRRRDPAQAKDSMGTLSLSRRVHGSRHRLDVRGRHGIGRSFSAVGPGCRTGPACGDSRTRASRPVAKGRRDRQPLRFPGHEFHGRHLDCGAGPDHFCSGRYAGDEASSRRSAEFFRMAGGEPSTVSWKESLGSIWSTGPSGFLRLFSSSFSPPIGWVSFPG